MQDFAENFILFWKRILDSFMSIGFFDIVDILIVTFIVYWIMKFFKDTKATQLIKGILAVLLILFAANILNLTATSFILASTIQFGALALIILFQPELRRILEQFGRKGVKNFIISEDKSESQLSSEMIDEIVRAAFSLSSTRTGALIAFERKTLLKDIVDTGTYINAECAGLLLENLFYHNSPLHDGGVIVSKKRILAAGCVFPLSDNLELAADLGMRHRAGIGLSEASDAVVLIVSEENGTISIATNGLLRRGFTRETLKEELSKYLLPAEEKKERIFSRVRRTKK